MYDEMIRFWAMKAYEACMVVQTWAARICNDTDTHGSPTAMTDIYRRSSWGEI